MIEITFTGSKELNEKLAKIARELPRECERFLRQETKKVKGRVKNLTPARTGRLRNAWVSRMHGSYESEIFNNTYYSIYVEYGHRVKIHGKFTGTVVPGRYMLRDGIEDSRAGFVADANQILARLFG